MKNSYLVPSPEQISELLETIPKFVGIKDQVYRGVNADIASYYPSYIRGICVCAMKKFLNNKFCAVETRLRPKEVMITPYYFRLCVYAGRCDNCQTIYVVDGSKWVLENRK